MDLQMSSYEASFSILTVRSTTETSAVGTRNAIPVNFPFSSGITLPTALAAPVEEGMMFWAAPRPPRQSLPLGPSTVFWVAVVACTVVITPSMIPYLSLITFANGAKQLVVQDALETTWRLLSYFSWLTPITNIGASAEGAEMITFLAPPLVWAEAPSVVVNTTMYSAPALAQGMAVGSLSLKTVIFIPLTTRNLPSSFTSPLNLPWVESYLNM